MRNLIEFILLHIVQNPDAVKVVEEEVDGRFIFTISVHPDDVGRVIGRNGRTIEAIRSLAKVRAMKDGIAVQIKVASDDDRKNEAEAPEVSETEAV